MPDHEATTLPEAERPAQALVRPQETDDSLDHEDHPRGSLVLLLLMLAVMTGIWLYVYFLLLSRT